MEIENNIKIINGFYLLFVLILVGFVLDTFSCPIQKLLNNIFIKNLSVIIIIYFLVDFVDNPENPTSPLENLKYTIFIWIFYILFNRQNVYFALVIFMLSSFLFIMVSYKKYIKKKYENKIENYKIDNFIRFNSILILIITFIGFLIYLNKQYKDHKKKFSFIKFLLGPISCNTM